MPSDRELGSVRQPRQPASTVQVELSLEQFLAGLRMAWRNGEVRPTATPKEKAKRGRRRPDRLISVTALLRGWHEAEPWRTGRELLERLQSEQPGLYPDGLLRTVQRRLKGWRREVAHALVFGAAPVSTEASAEAAPGKETVL